MVTVSGRVSDEAGAAIAGTRVSFEDVSGKVSSKLSNAEGKFQFSLTQGIYKVAARYEEHQAWEQFILNEYQVTEGGKPLEIVLKVNERWTREHGSPIEGTPVDPVEKDKSKWPASEDGHSTLTGTVLDDYGAVIVGAKIVALGKDGTRLEAVVDENGAYVIKLPFGDYILQISKEGFCPTVFREYRIVNSTYGKMSLDIALSVKGSHTICSQSDIPTKSGETEKNKSEKHKSINKSIKEQ